MTRFSKSPRALALSAALAEARIKSGLNQRQAAKAFGCSQAIIARIEKADRGVTADEAATLMGIYHADIEARDHVLQLARDAGRESWSATGARDLSRSLDTLIKYEQQATAITEVQPLVVPGLLQTEAYARAVISAGRPVAEVDTAVAKRILRQEVLRKPSAPTFTAILDERVFLRPAGPGVLQDQAARILEWTERPNVEVRIIPLSVGLEASLSGGFVVLEFAESPTVVHLEHVDVGTWLHTPKDTKRAVDSLATLLTITLGSDESRAVVARYANGVAP